jgi:uncharacterized protein (DUF2236 family)
MIEGAMTNPPDVRDLMLRRGSPGWWYFGQLHNLLLGPQILVLQVAHPMVGAGVLQHSAYQREPWRRLYRTGRSLDTAAYGDERSALAEIARLREMHATIKGVDDQGRRYHALHPDAYAWVHATLVRGAVDAARVFGDGIPPAELPEYYDDMRGWGRLLGLRDHQLPADIAAFDEYYDTMVRERLEDNQAVRDVLASIERPAKPRTPMVPEFAWAPIARYLSDRAYLVTVGTLPPVLRDRLGLTWSDRQNRRLHRFARHVRWSLRVTTPPLVALARLARAIRRT